MATDDPHVCEPWLMGADKEGEGTYIHAWWCPEVPTLPHRGAHKREAHIPDPIISLYTAIAERQSQFFGRAMDKERMEEFGDLIRDWMKNFNIRPQP